MFGIDDALIGAVAAPLIGGLLGSKGSSQSQSSQQTLDPRMESAVYGANGVVPSAQNWYSNNKTGLNSQILTGMDNQWNQLGASAQGFNQMQNLGMGLMGGGAAGNPFTGNGGVAATHATYTPANMSMGVSNPFTQQYGVDQAAAAQKAITDKAAADEAARQAALQQVMQPYQYNGGSGNGGFGGLGQSSGYNSGFGGDTSHGTQGY